MSLCSVQISYTEYSSLGNRKEYLPGSISDEGNFCETMKMTIYCCAPNIFNAGNSKMSCILMDLSSAPLLFYAN